MKEKSVAAGTALLAGHSKFVGCAHSMFLSGRVCYETNCLITCAK